jgi:hypothetical protein
MGTEHKPGQRPLAFIYDRPTGGSTPTAARALMAVRIAACRVWADERGYQLAGSWVEDDDSDNRPRFEALLAMLRVHARQRPVLCLINGWPQLHPQARQQNAYARRVEQAGGWTETALGESTRGSTVDPLLAERLAAFWGDGR